MASALAHERSSTLTAGPRAPGARVPGADTRSLIRVHLTGGDHVGWAQDEGLRLTRLALSGRAEITDLEAADVVHAMWWRGALALPRKALVGKRVVSYVGEEVYRFAGE